MTKIPAAGNVKTRLRPVLSPDECLALAEAFLKDAAHKAKIVCEDVMVAYWPPRKTTALQELLPFQKFFVEQTGSDLGERMYYAFKFAFERKTDSVVMIGTDSPTFPADYIEQAFEFLETETDVVLGRTEDGGFYLIGLRNEIREDIFANVRWSSPETFEQVFGNIKKTGLHLREVPGWYDVDEPEDLKKLRGEILSSGNAQRRAPQTYELLRQWEKF